MVRVQDAVGVATARRHARALALALGFGDVAAEQIVLSVSELGHNLWQHAGGGTLTLEPLGGERQGLRVQATDEGPGIADVERALRDGVSSRGTIGSGLAAVRRLMDQLDVQSEPDQGTRVEATKWRS